MVEVHSDDGPRVLLNVESLGILDTWILHIRIFETFKMYYVPLFYFILPRLHSTHIQAYTFTYRKRTHTSHTTTSFENKNRKKAKAKTQKGSLATSWILVL